jgi:hypothetical protein
MELNLREIDLKLIRMELPLTFKETMLERKTVQK